MTTAASKKVRTPSFLAVDIKRAIKAAEAGGKSVAGVDFPREGGFRLLFGEPLRLEVASRSGRNEWDDVLVS